MIRDSRHYDVIVIGVGGMGSAACLELAKRGSRVLGLEQFEVGNDRGSSHGEARMIRRAYFEHPDYVPLLNRAYELWRELEETSGQRLFVQNGVVIYGDPSSSSVYQGTVHSGRKHGIPIEELDTQAATARFRLFRPGSLGAVFEPGAGFLHVERAVRAHAREAEKRGAEIHERETVSSYQAASDGISVRTDRETYSASKLVVAGGAWNTRLLADLGIPLELHRLNQYWFRASPDHALDLGSPCFAFHTGSGFYYGFPSLDGRSIKIGTHFARAKIADPSEKDVREPPPEDLKELRKFIGAHLSGVSPELERFTSCIYTMTPDEHFIVGAHPGHPNVVFAAGFSGHGFKFSPVMGEILADLALDGRTRHPIGFLGMNR